MTGRVVEGGPVTAFDFEKRLALAIVMNPDLTVGEMVQLIRGVSLAARAEAFAEIRRGVEDISGWRDESDGLIDRAAVLALLPPTEPKP